MKENKILENEVLIILCLYPDMFIKYSGTLNENLFTDDNKILYNEILKINNSKNKNLYEFTKKHNLDLSNVNVEVLCNFNKCLLILHEYRIKRELEKIVVKTLEKINNDDVFNAIEFVQIEISKLTDFSNIRSDNVKTISQHLADTLDIIGNNINKKEIQGIRTGIKDIDTFTTGFHGGQLIILAAQPGMGKTALALNIMRNCSIEDNKSCCFFSFEMSVFQLITRLLAMETDIDSKKLMRSKITIDDLREINSKINPLSQSKIIIDEGINNNLNDVLNRMRKYKQKYGTELFLIDYLHLIKSLKKERREQEVSDIARSLKNIAKELNVPVIALSQLNRNVEHNVNKEPRLSNLRESGEIEAAADIVIFLHNPHKDDKEKPELNNYVEFIIAKGRDIGMCNIALNFKKETSRFLLWENKHEEILQI